MDLIHGRMRYNGRRWINCTLMRLHLTAGGLWALIHALRCWSWILVPLYRDLVTHLFAICIICIILRALFSSIYFFNQAWNASCDIANFATSFSANNLFSVHLDGLFRHKLIIRVSAHVRPLHNSGKIRSAIRTRKKSSSDFRKYSEEIRDIARCEWKLWWRFSNITTVIAFTFWIMQAVSATPFARIITELMRDMKKNALEHHVTHARTCINTHMRARACPAESRTTVRKRRRCSLRYHGYFSASLTLID